jgi:hypothetical protein
MLGESIPLYFNGSKETLLNASYYTVPLDYIL